MKKSILIDVVNEEIREITIGTDYREFYPIIGCNCFTIVRIDNDNDVIIDDEGLLKLTPNSKFFLIEGYPTPLAGNGLILGIDNSNGKSIDTTLTVDEVKRRVRFMELWEAREYAMEMGY